VEVGGSGLSRPRVEMRFLDTKITLHIYHFHSNNNNDNICVGIDRPKLSTSGADSHVLMPIIAADEYFPTRSMLPK